MTSDEPIIPDVPGPYGIDLIITLSTGSVRLSGEYLDWDGVRDVLNFASSAIPKKPDG